MDVKVQWKVCSDPESLIAVIVACRDELVEVAKAKHRLTRVGLVSSEAFAGDKLLEMLQLSDKWKPLIEVFEVTVRPNKRNPNAAVLVADMGQFKLYRSKVMGTEMIRVIVNADVGEDCVQTFYGTVEVGG